MKTFSRILLFSTSALLLGMGACKKSFLDRYPSDRVPLEDAFKTTTGCRAALEGMHSLMYKASDDDNFGQMSINLINDLMGEDMVMHDAGAGWFTNYVDYTTPRNGGAYIWSYYYQFVNNANELLAHIDNATGPQSEKDNIKGQVYFYLAYAYYNLSLYYQHSYMVDSTALGVPIYHAVTQEGGPRAPLTQLYKEITDDLDKAVSLLDPANGAPQRANKSEIDIDVVHGLYARVALVMQRWRLADQMAGLARQNYPYMSTKELLSGFNNWQNSSWIWGSHITEDQTNHVWSFISHMDPTSGGYAEIGGQKLINKTLFNLIPHDSNSAAGYDIRYQWWAKGDQDPYFKFSQKKFRIQNPGTFSLDVCYMRSEEMGFIQAEAKAHFDIPGAQAQLEEIMKIRNPNYSAASFTSQAALLHEIWHQRRIELWGEGFRYSDLQRCAAIPEASSSDYSGFLFYQGLHRENSGGQDALFGNYKTIADPVANTFLFRISGGEINYNPNIVQNP
ncbi:MAG TPA: RagB/SusD family nutrient uptake outer membrane protein [Edaphocola sp.]|nr:RagB/SusD family nutrient uptake outer membrane protein [Edaphocola sp.]